MTVKEAVARMRSSVHDTAMEFSDAELLRFLNTGIADVAARCIAEDSTDFVRTVDVHDADALPQGFVRTAGRFPVRMEAGRFYLPQDVTEMRLRCFCLPREASLSDEDLGVRGEHLQELVVRTAVLLVLNEHEFDVTQDMALLQSLVQDAAAAKKMTPQDG